VATHVIMQQIPITLLFFTSTKGHFGFKDIYLDTLNYLNRKIPLSSFAQKIAHIKVSSLEQEQAAKMTAELEKRGFTVIAVTADWSHGIAHQNEYMKDLIRVSKRPEVYKNDYVLWLEDDSPFEFHNEVTIERGFYRSLTLLTENPDLISVRFLRRNDLHDSPIIEVPNKPTDYFYSPHYNFQPSILRSRDFFLACKIIEDNFDKITNVQSEMLWRLVLGPMSRSELKHIVWWPDYGETYHLGSPDYPKLKEQLKL
jgi:hypothetical protein